MSRKLFVLLSLGTALSLSSAALAQRPTAQADVAPARIIGEYICVFDGSVARSNVRAEADRIIAREGGQALHHYTHAIRGFAARLPDQAIERLVARNPSIAYCEQNQVVRAVYQRRAGKPGGGGGTQPAQTTPWGVTRVGGGSGTPSGDAWVIDSGIDLDHPDLNVDVARSRSFIRDASPDDQNGHGTHVAGTIAAINNTIGVVGVAPGATVISVRVLDRRGSGTVSGVIDGVDYVAQVGRPGDVANMSLGGGVSTALDTAVVNAAATGVRFTLAAGNESDDANNHSPARANGTNVYTVSAFSRTNDTWASFSNYGNPPIDFAEPGVSIPSTYKDGGYATLSGTSMAAPHLAGLLLLGPVRSGGTVNGDPSAPADTIGVH